MYFSVSDLMVSGVYAQEVSTGATSGEMAVETPYELTAEKMMMDNLLILGMLFFIFYFILIRPQQKRLKAHKSMLSELKKGSKIMTSGGLIGSITKFDGDDVVIVEIAPDTKVKIARSAITDVVGNTAGKSANDN